MLTCMVRVAEERRGEEEERRGEERRGEGEERRGEGCAKHAWSG